MAENTATAPASQPVAGPKDGILGMLSVFIDPAATARRVTMRWFWVYPFVVMSAALILLQIVATPYRTRATELMLQEQGITGQAAQERLAMMAKFAPVGWVVTPIITLVIIALSAWLVSVAASIIDAGVRYAYLFSLASVMGMFYVLQTVAGILVLRSKSVDDITSMKDLQAPFGLDIFLHDLPKVLQGIASFFSVFEIWAIIMYALTFAALARTTKGKGFIATAPAWILGLLFAIVGAVLTPG